MIEEDIIKEFYIEGGIKNQIIQKNGNLSDISKPSKINYWYSGEIKSYEYYLDNKKHRIDGPAVVEFYQNGEIHSMKWYLYGMNHRLDGPAIIVFGLDKKIESEYYFVIGWIHRDDGPAITYHSSDHKSYCYYSSTFVYFCRRFIRKFKRTKRKEWNLILSELEIGKFIGKDITDKIIEYIY